MQGHFPMLALSIKSNQSNDLCGNQRGYFEPIIIVLLIPLCNFCQSIQGALPVKKHNLFRMLFHSSTIFKQYK